jgi:glycosyltransferase involved in cell wall biosynthesis
MVTPLRSSSSPLISVVIPSYNHGGFVIEAVDSALAQTYENIEVIVIDDGSEDDTAERLARYGDRVRYHRQENQGLSAARNTGIRLAAGEWVAFLDADDVWHPQKLQLQVAALLANPDLVLLGAPGRTVTDTATRAIDELPETSVVHRLTLRDFLVGTPFGPSSMVIRRDCFGKVGAFDVGLGSVEDRDLCLRVAARHPSARIEAVSWWYREHDGQMSRNAQRMYENYVRVLDTFFATHPESANLRRAATAFMYRDGALAFSMQGDRWVAVRLILNSLATWPLPLGLPGRPRGDRLAILVRLLVGSSVYRRLRVRLRRPDRRRS